MNVWYTSDLHIGHRLIAGLRLNAHSNPPMSGEVPDEGVVRWHDDTLAANWDAVVKDDDIVWVLGDISVGGATAQKNALQWLSNRPGHKHLIAGNHDGAHPMHRISYLWLPEYLKVFDTVQQSATHRIPIPDRGSKYVLVSHFPYEGEGDRAPDRYTQWRLRDEGMPVIHGHVHSKEKVTLSTHQHPGRWEDVDGLYAPAKQIHVGLDAWDLNLVSLDQISELLQ